MPFESRRYGQRFLVNPSCVLLDGPHRQGSSRADFGIVQRRSERIERSPAHHGNPVLLQQLLRPLRAAGQHEIRIRLPRNGSTLPKHALDIAGQADTNLFRPLPARQDCCPFHYICWSDREARIAFLRRFLGKVEDRVKRFREVRLPHTKGVMFGYLSKQRRVQTSQTLYLAIRSETASAGP